MYNLFKPFYIYVIKMLKAQFVAQFDNFDTSDFHFFQVGMPTSINKMMTITQRVGPLSFTKK